MILKYLESGTVKVAQTPFFKNELMASETWKLATCLTLASATFSSLSADDVYKHAGVGSFLFVSAAEYGDEVVLAGWFRILTGFSFEYAANYELPAGLTFRIYSQNGPVIGGASSPGTRLFETKIDVVNGGRVVNIGFVPDRSEIVPDRLTYTVEFAGVTGGNSAGLLAPGGTPVIGSSANDFWEKTGPGANDWAVRVFTPGSGTPSANFIATITAVPEPSTVALMVAGAGLVLVALSRK